jgi:hypothetical protein
MTAGSQADKALNLTSGADLAHESLTDSSSYAKNLLFATNDCLTAGELSAYAQTIV